MDGEWNLDAVTEVLSHESRSLNINWNTVTQLLDHPNLLIRSEMDFHILTRIFVRISGMAIPGPSLLRVWNNRTAQLAVLVMAANSQRNVVDFLPLISPEQRMQGEIPFPPNFSWMCPQLYVVLLELASGGLFKEVLEAISVASGFYPEYVTICLAAQVQDNSGVRAEILRRTLPLFTGLPGSRASSSTFMMRLLQVNPDLLVLLFRIALKRANTVQDILETDMKLKSLGGLIARRVEEEGNVDELLGYWCVKADRSTFNLEEVATAILERNPQIARAFAAFAKDHSDTLRPRGVDGGLLSYESYTVLLMAIQRYPQVVPIEEVRSLAATMAQHQQNSSQLHQTQQQGMSQVDKVNSHGEQSELIRNTSNPDFDNVEEEANAYFQKIYASDERERLSVDQVIQLLKRLKNSEISREQEIFRSMIHNLFDEYRFFQKYPDPELEVTGNLFGTLIRHQLVSSITLGIALRYVLEALRKDPEQGGTSEKMFRFGKIALEQFRVRLGEWPQYCSHLIQIPHFSRYCLDLFQDAQRALANPSPQPASGGAFSNGDLNMAEGLDIGKGSTSSIVQQMGGMSVSDRPPVLSRHTSESSILATATSASTTSDTNTNKNESKSKIIERMAQINIDVVCSVMPPEGLRDQIHFIVNNIAKSNVEQKSIELRGLLTEEYYNWFASYLVVKRISTQPNLHSLYLSLFATIDQPALWKVVLDSTYHNVTKLLMSPNITTSSSERSVLRNLGVWLGQMTLARSKPLLHRRICLKDLLFWGYETGRLIAVCSFVAKIVEGSRDSKVFRPPNPWLMALLGVLRELYEIEDLKMNIKFEVQVLCKNINIKIEDIPRGNLLAQCNNPIKNVSNPDFNVKSVAVTQSNISPSLGGTSAISTPSVSSTPVTHEEIPKPTADANAALANEQTVIPNLASYVTISPSLQFFVQNPTHRKLVPLAVDRAIREIIQPVVERSVAIASVTTKQLVLKDYSTEPNEQQLRAGAHLMISNLAASLALATCKEPLRVSIGNHLRSLFTQVSTDQAVVEQIVQVCCADNSDLGCMLIEKAAMEKAVRDVDESLASAMQARRKARETGQPFVDTATPKNGKYPRDLPDALKPRVGGLHPQQIAVYESFRQRATAQQQAQVPTDAQPGTAGATGDVSSSGSVNPSLDMSQALQAYQIIFNRIDTSLKSIQMQSQGREISISMLGTDHEIITLLRDMVILTQRIFPQIRNETAMTFCENIFKRMIESANIADTLRLEVMIGIIEALRDACGGAKKFVPEIVSWLSHYAVFNPNDENGRKIHLAILILLLRAKLMRSQDADVYLATYMDGGRNMLWVELALTFVRQCLAEGLAATYEFTQTFDTVSKMRPANAAIKKQLQKWLTDLRTLAVSKDEEKSAAAAAAPAVNPTTGVPTSSTVNPAVRDSLRENVTLLLERWLRVWNSTNDQIFSQYLQLMHSYGVLKTEEAADRFFCIATELCVDACLKSAQIQQEPAGAAAIPASALNYTVVDALSKLFLLLIRLAEKEAGDITVRVNLLNRILNAIARILLEDHEAKKNGKFTFDQRPYFRLMSNLAQDLGIPDPKQEPNPSVAVLLATFSQVYIALQPTLVPGFALAWLQLISHRTFMPQLLLVKNQKGWPYMHRLLIALLGFLHPFLKHAQLNDSIRRLYKGTLKILLVLLHDFPDFLSDYHLSFCETIPSTCVQLRNLILSAFPRSMRPPDPFTPNLKIDTLPEIMQAPRILTDYVAVLNDRGIRSRIDTYLSSKQPADLPSLLPSVLVAPGSPGSYNLSLMISIVVYIGAQGIIQLQNKTSLLQTSAAMDLFKGLIVGLDAEGRYHLLNAITNQLRYPNSHTYYFSCVLLHLFVEAENEFLQEQITRVLLERLIVLRPHPWGLLITFIELIKQPRYAFWKKNFTRFAPEIERVFESVARSCMGSANPTPTEIKEM